MDNKTYLIFQLRRRVADLEQENAWLRSQNEHAETRIACELEPLIVERNRRYDDWATTPERGAL